MVLYMVNYSEFTKTLLELKNEFNKVAEYKVNIEKSIVFPHTSNEQSENKKKKIIPFTKASNNNIKNTSNNVFSNTLNQKKVQNVFGNLKNR